MGRAAFQLEPYEQSEHELQIDCTKMLRRVLLPPDQGVQWTAIDHAHSLDRRSGRWGEPIGLLEATKRKARGIRSGIPDYLFWRGGRSFTIELKRNASEPLNDNQKDFCQGLLDAEVPFKICWSKDLVFYWVKAWGLVRPGTVMI